MVQIKGPRRGRPPGPAKLLVPVKMLPEQRKRFKVMCAAQGVSYEEKIVQWMDNEEANARRKAARQAHPLHQPKPASYYPGGGRNG
ncbi:hypothetical protein SEA_VINCENZO_64 [Mycobacterium phage Vincenzo]|uniref:Ribbon-helix-helix DNA binding domain protein n=2 Tax=Coopervirus vincenzo TaxID=1983110 RepID=A0A0F6YQ62_9CAUD|nr:hypothetical protein SEA_VINCENZO_64 [Mycobacterium phage Vincenzo]AKF14326.1 hypothetical protein SEA_VINCENZO_64 [Mycobacterium phage Vincenzo]AKF14730.1 hypothetical protein SEA_ALANGRANT_65 [Mycobacterium phage AlanGrant]